MKAKKRFFGLLLASCLVAGLMSASVFAEDSDADLVISATDSGDTLTEGTDYTYDEGKLVIQTTTPATIKMKDGVTTTSDTIQIDTKNGAADVTLDSLKIETSDGWSAIELDTSGESQANSCTLHLKGTNSLSNTYQYGYVIRTSDDTHLIITSDDNGTLNLHNTGNNGVMFAIDSGNLTIEGNAKVDVTSVNHTAINNFGMIKICENAEVSLSASNESAALTSKTRSGESGENDGITITDNAKVTISSGEQGIYNNGKGTIVIGGNTDVDISGVKKGIYAITSASKTIIEGNAQVDIKAKERGVELGRSSDAVEISDNSSLDITIIKAEEEYRTTYGFYNVCNGLTISYSAKVTVTGLEDTYGVSGDGITTIQGQAELKLLGDRAFSTDITYTVSPAEGNLYAVSSGDSKEEATTQYYSKETGNLESNEEFFHVYSTKISQITGTVTISGNAAYGETLTANYTVSGETVSYQWKRGDADIAGATGSTYTLTEDDIGQTITVVVTGTGVYSGSASASTEPVGKGSQEKPSENDGYTVDYSSETISAKTGYELAGADNAETGSQSLAAIPGATVYVRLSGTDVLDPSPWTAVTLPARPEAPSDVTGGTMSISGLDAGMEYKAPAHAGEEAAWIKIAEQDLQNGVLSGLSEGSYQVRLAATDSAFASESVTVTVTERISGNLPEPSWRPNVPETEGGEVEISPANPAEGDTVTVTPRPEDGYEVGGVTVTDGRGSEVEVTDNGNGSFSFVQPDAHVTVTVAFVPKFPFEDVPEGAWYRDAVEYAYTNGLMDGVSATTFAPDANMTRAMLVTILWRMEGEPVVNCLLPFTDVDSGEWYAEAVRWAASEGIVTGVSDTSFAPNAEITREQLAAILYRYAGEPATAANLAGYADGASVSAYAVDAMSWCVEQGIITGTTATTLEPQGTATRAQAAAMLMRFAENLK